MADMGTIAVGIGAVSTVSKAIELVKKAKDFISRGDTSAAREALFDLQDKVSAAREALLDLQDKLLDVREEKQSLRERVVELELQLELEDDLQFDGRVYRSKSAPDPARPYCQKCWDDNHKKVNLHRRENSSSRLYWHCTVCSTNF